MTLAETFGRVLKKCRLELNLSQAELADLAELDRTYISMLERGERQPTLGTIFQIARCLDIRPSELIKLAETRTKTRRSVSPPSRRL